MDEELKKEFPYDVRVKLKGFRKFKAFSDLVVTFCCSATPCYYVVFPSIGYEGYFQESDVELKSQDKQCWLARTLRYIKISSRPDAELREKESPTPGFS
jgi:hypothetical protein